MPTLLLDVFGMLIELTEYRSPWATLMECSGLTLAQQRAVTGLVQTRPLADLHDVADFIEARHPGTHLPGDRRVAAQAELEAHLASCRLIDGAAELLTDLRQRGWRLGLLSNISCSYMPAITNPGLQEMVHSEVYSWQTGFLKPDPRIFQAALDQLGAEATETVMVGDDFYADIEGARQVGIRAVWIDPDDGNVDSIADVKRLLLRS